MSRRWFTPTDARSELDRLRPAAERMCDLYRALEAHGPAAVPERPVAASYFALLRDLDRAVRAIVARGVEVKDVGRGLLDFPARRGGRAVLLCWKVGEPALAWWHELDAGYAGRRPVDDDGPWD